MIFELLSGSFLVFQFYITMMRQNGHRWLRGYITSKSPKGRQGSGKPLVGWASTSNSKGICLCLLDIASARTSLYRELGSLRQGRRKSVEGQSTEQVQAISVRGPVTSNFLLSQHGVFRAASQLESVIGLASAIDVRLQESFGLDQDAALEVTKLSFRVVYAPLCTLASFGVQYPLL